MRTISLDASKWTSIDDFYDALLPALGAPSGHGRGINSLIDSIVGGGMNAVEPPYAIIIHATAGLDDAVRDHLETARDFLAEVRVEQREEWGREIEATIELLK